MDRSTGLIQDRFMKIGPRLCWLTFVSFALSLFSAPAQDHHPIDLKLNAALEKDLSTADQLAAIAAAMDEWNALMAQLLGQLQKELPGTTADALKLSQRSWEVFH